MYEGQFSMDKRQGFGRLFWDNGTYYVGHWHNDLRNGFGRLSHANGKVEQGSWMEGKLIKEQAEDEERQDRF